MDTTHPVGHVVVEPPSDLAATAAEAAGGADGSACFNPLVGFGTADLVAGLQALATHVIRQPWSLLAPNLTLLTKLAVAWFAVSDLARQPKGTGASPTRSGTATRSIEL